MRNIYISVLIFSFIIIFLFRNKKTYEKFSIIDIIKTKINTAKDYVNNDINDPSGKIILDKLDTSKNINVKGNLHVYKKLTVKGGGDFNSSNSSNGRYIFQTKNGKNIRVGTVDNIPGILSNGTYSVVEQENAQGCNSFLAHFSSNTCDKVNVTRNFPNNIRITSKNKIVKFKDNAAKINNDNLTINKINNINENDLIKTYDEVYFYTDRRGPRRGFQGTQSGSYIKNNVINSGFSKYIVSRCKPLK